MIPQIAYVTIILIGLGYESGKHGQPKEGKYNGWVCLVANIIVVAILYAGGFFDVFK